MHKYFKHEDSSGALEFIRVVEVKNNVSTFLSDIEVRPLNPNYRFEVTNEMKEITRDEFLELVKTYNLGLIPDSEAVVPPQLFERIL